MDTIVRSVDMTKGWKIDPLLILRGTIELLGLFKISVFSFVCCSVAWLNQFIYDPYYTRSV